MTDPSIPDRAQEIRATKMAEIQEALYPTRDGYCAELIDIEQARWLLDQLRAAQSDADDRKSRMIALSELVSRIWAATKAEGDGNVSVVDVVAELRQRAETAEARITELEAALQARASSGERPTSEYEQPRRR